MKFLFSLLILLLAGCGEPKFLTDEKNLHYPKRTRSGVNFVPSETDLRRMAWWQKLKDPLLNQLIVTALCSSDQVKSSAATIEQAKAQLKAAYYAWLPTLDANVDGFAGRTWHTRAKPMGPLARNALFSNFSNPKFQGYDAGFAPGYSVNILNNISNINSARASLAINQALDQSTKLTIISQMSGAYFMLLGQREQLRIEHALCRDLRTLRQLEQIRFNSGASDISTLINLDQQLAAEEAKIPPIESVISQNENTIQLLLNQNPGSVKTEQSFLSLKPDHLIPQNLPSAVLKNRPDIMIAYNNLKIADANIGIAYSAFFPTLSLTNLIGKASIDLRHLLKLSTNLWLAQAVASTKILNASAYQNVKAAKASFSATYFDYLHTLRQAFVDVDNSLTLAQKNEKAYLLTEKVHIAAKKAYELALRQYKAGATDYRNVINAKINLEHQQLSLVQEKAQFLDSLVQVYNAVAGGYEVSA